MKRIALLAGALSLGLAACTQNGGVNIGQGFDGGVNISGAKVTVAVVEVQDSSGTTVGYRSTYTLTQPTVTFNVLPQSLGMQVQSFTVEVLDNAGTRYDSDLGKYQRSVNYVVQPGFVCSTASTALSSCTPNAKVATGVSTSFGDMNLVTSEIASAIAGDCQTTGCPTLKMKVTMSGVDDAGISRTLIASGAVLDSSVTSRTVVKQ